MTTVEIKAPVVGHYKIKHYRRDQLINEIGCNNAIDPAWIRTGLLALAQGVTDNNNVTITPRSPTSMRVKYYPSSSPTSQVSVDKDVVVVANGAQSTGVDQVTSRSGGLIAEFTATGSGSGYILSLIHI